MRRMLGFLFAATLAVASAACGTSAPADPTSGCSHWCGNASATVTFGGRTTTINGGGCYNQGIAGIDVRIGDWQENSSGDYLTVTGYPPGDAAPSATAVPTDAEGNDIVDSSVAGSIGGTPFVLGEDATIRFASATAGSFSGADVNGYGDVSGTFTCG